MEKPIKNEKNDHIDLLAKVYACRLGLTHVLE